MSTNANLPAGFKITSINGKRCTQVPRSLTTIAGETSFATTTTEAAAQTTTSTTPPPENTTSNAQVQGNSPQSTIASVSPTSSAEPTTSIASKPPSAPDPEPALETTISSTPLPAAATTSVPQAAASSTSTSETPTSASPASKGTTPTTSSITSIPIAQSEVSATPTSTAASGLFDNGVPSVVSSSRTSISPTATTSSAHAADSSAATGISSNPKLSAGPVVGGVIGGLALLGMIAFLLWFLRRRRRRDSLLTPLTTGTKEGFYEIDRGSVGPTSRSTKWKATLGYQSEKLREGATVAIAGIVGLGASLKSKVVGDRTGTPSVNLNRGNSQFLDGPISQHSRNNSSAPSNHTGQLTVRDRLNDWWARFAESLNFNWRLRQRDRQSMDPFASARSMKEQQANSSRPPDFSQLLGMDDRELQLQAERRRASLSQSLSQSLPQIGSLGLDFTDRQDPFADPAPKSNAGNQAWKPPNTSTNPFADPIAPPSRSIPKGNTYISEIRRSRGLSMDTTSKVASQNITNTNTNPNLPPSTTNNKTTSIAPTSRYPSSIAPTSRNSFRDTVLSSFSANVRKGKGRSDPFDLERPELWRPKFQNPPMPAPRDSTKALYPDPLQTSSPRKEPRVVSTAGSRIVSETGTYASKYSSGVGSDTEWGDPGPDIGSIRSDESVLGSAEMGWDRLREVENGTPVSLESKASSKGVVGKAM